MEIHIKESTIVRPAKETPKHCLQISDLDLLGRAAHVPTVYFYRRPNDSGNFFETSLLKETLSKVLVPFYPVAGRFERDKNGRIEIQCNGEGVIFIEAETSCSIDDLGNFVQGRKLLQLVPAVDYTENMSSHPLLLIQVTRFKCEGVCLGFALHHTFADATSHYKYFINGWAEMTCGQPISILPFFNRAVLSAGVPTSPTFHHVEYDSPPSLNNSKPNQEFQSNPEPLSISTTILRLSLDQINFLKALSKKDPRSTMNCSRFEILAAHVWRCMCAARGLSDDQASKLHIATDGRSRLNPPILSGYMGNVIFTATSIALSGDIQSEPLSYTVERIHKDLKRMDNEYLKSALAYIKQQPDPTILRRGSHTFKCPNLNISNLSRIPMYAANFGWGRPMFVRTITLADGVIHILPSPSDDGSLLVVINLDTSHIQLFEKLFYEIFVEHTIARSKY